jgi:flagellar basal body-associated protein FliL
MAEKPAKAAEAAPAAKKEGTPAEKPAAGAAGGGGGLFTKLPVLLGGAMIIEAVVLFAGFKFLGGGGPKNANGADLTTQASQTAPAGAPGAAGTADPNALVEIDVLDFKAPNKLSGRTFLYDVSIYVTAKPEDQPKLLDLIKSHDALIQDRVRTIIAESDPDKLGGGSEPGLETLRRQVKYQLDEILGEGMIDEVLIPRCIPYRTDF